MKSASASLRERIAAASGQSVFRCYQCGNCSAGCPMAGRGDMLPHQVLRRLQMDDEAPLRALQPWLCVGCLTCATRCPQEVDLSRVMDALRAEALRRKTAPAGARRIRLFNQIFVQQVLAGGRLSEMQLGAFYNLRARVPFQNLSALPGLLRRGKLRLGGHVVRGLAAARREGRRP